MKIRRQPTLENVAGNALGLDSVGKRENVNFGAMWTVTLVDAPSIAELDGQVLAGATVDLDLALFARWVRGAQKHGFLLLLALHDHTVAGEDVQQRHGVLVHADDGIVIVGTVVHDQSIFGSFLLWSSGSHIGNVYMI